MGFHRLTNRVFQGPCQDFPMRRFSPLLSAVFVATFALSGCFGGGDGDGDGGDGTGTTPAPTTGGPPSTGPGGTTQPPPGTLAPATGSCDGTITSAVVVTQILRCEFSDMVDVEVAQYESAVIELTWDSLEPGVLGVYLALETDSCMQGLDTDCTEGEASGTASPLRLEVPPSAYSGVRDDAPKAAVTVDGAAAQQAFTITVTLYDGPIPAA